MKFANRLININKDNGLTKINMSNWPVKFNSAIIAILCMRAYIFISTSFIPGFEEFYFVFVLVLLGFLFSSIILGTRIKINSLLSVSILILLIITLYSVSYFTGNIGEENLLQIFEYCFLPMLCILLQTDFRKILEYIMIISLLSVSVINQLFEYQYNSIQQTDMSRAYAVFVPVVAAILHFVWYRSESNILIKICYLYNIFLLFKLLTVGNRGIILSLAFAFFVVMIRDLKNVEIGIKKKKRLMFILIICIVIIIIISINIEMIILWAYNYSLKNLKTVPSFVLKMHRLVFEKADITNGRIPLTMFFVEKIIRKPIYGYGMGMSSRLSNGIYPYPHNFILQFLFEGGLFFAVYPVILTIRGIFKTFTGNFKNKNTEGLAVFLMCNCIPKLLVSGDIWMQPIFWMWLAFLTTKPFMIKNKNE